MEGYDKSEALAYMIKNIRRGEHKRLSPHIDGLLKQMIDLDLQYMDKSGALGTDGYEGNSFYDDDDAFEFMLDQIVKERGLKDDEELLVASLLDDYMDLQQTYLESKGLLGWDE